MTPISVVLRLGADYLNEYDIYTSTGELIRPARRGDGSRKVFGLTGYIPFVLQLGAHLPTNEDPERAFPRLGNLLPDLRQRWIPTEFHPALDLMRADGGTEELFAILQYLRDAVHMPFSEIAGALERHGL